jgi:flavin-dependent dehydrogenase
MAMESGQIAVEAPRKSRERIVMMHHPKQSQPHNNRGYIIDSASLRRWMERQAAAGKVQSN